MALELQRRSRAAFGLSYESKLLEPAHVEIRVAIKPVETKEENPRRARHAFGFVGHDGISHVAVLGVSPGGFHPASSAVLPGCACPRGHVFFQYYDRSDQRLQQHGRSDLPSLVAADDDFH